MLGIGTLAKKVFGTPNDRKIKATRPLIEQINALEPEFEKLSDEALKDKTGEFRKRVQDGESLDKLLPEAFANCREAARRALGLRAFDVQLMGGIFLHQGSQQLNPLRPAQGMFLHPFDPVKGDDPGRLQAGKAIVHLGKAGEKDHFRREEEVSGEEENRNAGKGLETELVNGL